jgi:hypothetical protein
VSLIEWSQGQYHLNATGFFVLGIVAHNTLSFDYSTTPGCKEDRKRRNEAEARQDKTRRPVDTDTTVVTE